MARLLEGKVAVVTGGASGNGRATCVRFAEEGAAAVIVADLRADPREGGEDTTELVRRLGTEAVYVEADVTKPADLQRAVAAAGEVGGIDVLVSNAGVAGLGF